MGSFDVSQILTGQPLQDALIIALASDEEQGFVASKVAKRFVHKAKKGQIKIMGYTDKIKNTAPRADEQPANESLKIGLYGIDFECVSLDERTLFTDTEKNSDTLRGDLLKSGVVMALANLIKLKREKMFAKLATTTSNYASGYYDTAGAGDKFNKVGNDSYPVAYLLDKAETLRRKMGLYPDSIMFTTSSWRTFLSNPNVSDKLPDNKYKTVTEADVIPLLKTGALKYLKNVIIAGAVEDENIDSNTRSPLDIYNDDVMIYKEAQVQDNGDLGSGLVQAGHLLGVETSDPVHYGAMEYEPANKEKGVWIEDRYAYKPLMIKNENNTVCYGYLIKDTNV
jgi:hypothetical protein